MKINKILISALLFSLSIAFTACDNHDSTGYEYAPNMYHPVGYEPLSQIDSNHINQYGMNMRLPVDGTISRRNYKTKFGLGDSAVADLMVYNINKDSLSIAERVLVNPVPNNEKTLAEGKELYVRYCWHCHGENGEGNGPVAEKYKGVPNYKSDAYKNMNGGHVFHVITHGKGRMWPHGSQVSPEERWKIVHYVYTLQKG